MYRSLPTERVSVIIPVGDDLDYLDRCLDALDMQTYPPHEIIVVDRDPRMRATAVAASRGALVVREPSLTDAAAMAVGYNQASGDIIARLDADSIPGATWVSSVCESFTLNTSAAAVTASGVIMEDDGRARPRSTSLSTRTYFGLLGLALGHPPLRGSAFAMRREVWQQSRDDLCVDDARQHVDIDLSIHLAGAIIVDPTLAVTVSTDRSTVNGGANSRPWRGLATVLRHWPREFPIARAARRLGAPTPLIESR